LLGFMLPILRSQHGVDVLPIDCYTLDRFSGEVSHAVNWK
jgi:hypothetical protein